MKKLIVQLIFIAFLLWIGQGYYMVDGKIDWWILSMVVGIPFGIPYMFFVIPLGGSVITSLGILTFNVLVGAFCGVIIVAIVLIKAAVLIPSECIKRIYHLIR